MVVADLCNRARRFLRDIGKGEKVWSLTHIRSSDGEDEDYNSADDEDEGPPSDWVGSSQVQSSNQVSSPALVAQPVAPRDAEPASDEYGSLVLSSDDWQELFDIEQKPESEEDEGERKPNRRKLLDDPLTFSEAPEGVANESQESGNAGPRETTKLRVMTLAYLWNFRKDAEGLRRAFKDLTDGRHWILHLCGCGMPAQYVDRENRQVRYSGCVEGTHLMLGDSEVNRRHLDWHKVMAHAKAEDYPLLCSVAQRSEEACAGLF